MFSRQNHKENTWRGFEAKQEVKVDFTDGEWCQNVRIIFSMSHTFSGLKQFGEIPSLNPEMYEFLAECIFKSNNLLNCGDFNHHVDWTSKKMAINFIALLDSLDLSPCPIYELGLILELVVFHWLTVGANDEAVYISDRPIYILPYLIIFSSDLNL